MAIANGMASRARARSREIRAERWPRLIPALLAFTVMVGCGDGGRIPSATAPPYPFASESGSVSDLSDVLLLVKERPPTQERLQAYLQGAPAFGKAAERLPAEALQQMAGKSPIEGFAATVTSRSAGPTLAAALRAAGVDPLDFYATHILAQAYAIARLLEQQQVPIQAEAVEAEKHLREVREQAQRELAVGRVEADNLRRLNEEMSRAQAMAEEASMRLRLKQAVDALTAEQRALLEKFVGGPGRSAGQTPPPTAGGTRLQSPQG